MRVCVYVCMFCLFYVFFYWKHCTGPTARSVYLWQPPGHSVMLLAKRGDGAWPTLNPNPAAPQLCDLQLLLNCSESQISQLQNKGDLGKHLAQSQNVERGSSRGAPTPQPDGLVHVSAPLRCGASVSKPA